MCIILLTEDHKVMDKIIAKLKLTFKAERPPLPKAKFSLSLLFFIDCIYFPLYYF